MNITGITHRGGKNGMWAGLATEGDDRFAWFAFPDGRSFSVRKKNRAAFDPRRPSVECWQIIMDRKDYPPAPSAPSCRRSGRRCDLALA
jgi:hypothetical protein